LKTEKKDRGGFGVTDVTSSKKSENFCKGKDGATFEKEIQSTKTKALGKKRHIPQFVQEWEGGLK